MKKTLPALAALVIITFVVSCNKNPHIPVPDNEIVANWKLDSTVYLKYFDSILVQQERKYFFSDRLNLGSDNTYRYTHMDSVLSFGKYIYYDTDKQLVFSDGYTTTEASVKMLTNNTLNYVVSNRHPDPDSSMLREEKWYYYTK